MRLDILPGYLIYHYLKAQVKPECPCQPVQQELTIYEISPLDRFSLSKTVGQMLGSFGVFFVYIKVDYTITKYEEKILCRLYISQRLDIPSIILEQNVKISNMELPFLPAPALLCFHRSPTQLRFTANFICLFF